MAAAGKHFLLTLLRAKPGQQILLLKTADKQQLLALKELAVNVLSGNIELSASQKDRLKKYKDFFTYVLSEIKKVIETLYINIGKNSFCWCIRLKKPCLSYEEIRVDTRGSISENDRGHRGPKHDRWWQCCKRRRTFITSITYEIQRKVDDRVEFNSGYGSRDVDTVW